MRFFSTLNFTSANEDGRTELDGLSGAEGPMICLTGSGTRPLDMLLSDAPRVIALDLNPAQNALLALKIAAFRMLDRGETLTFLGVTEGDRRALWPRVRQALSEEDAAWWDARQGSVRRGLWYAGRWEKVLRLGARGTRALRGRQIDRLFSAPDVATQSALWRTRFDDRLWRGSIRLLGRRFIWTRIVGEPGGAFLPAPAEVEARLAGAFDRAAASFLFRDSDFASLILRGRMVPADALPLHLTDAHFETVQARLGRIEIRLGGLHQLDAETGAGAFSLSDFGSYTAPDDYAEAWRGVLRAARRNARFVERAFMNPLPVPDPRILVDRDLSARLTARDRAIIYDIRAGTLAV